MKDLLNDYYKIVDVPSKIKIAYKIKYKTKQLIINVLWLRTH